MLAVVKRGSDVKKTYYIKFINPKDAELFQPLYFTEREVQAHCPKCGSVLYLPVEIERERTTINLPMGEIFKPFPKERPDFIIRDDPPKPTLTYLWSKEWITPETRRQLGYRFGNSLLMVDQKTGYIEIMIDGFSLEPADCEVCNPQPEPNLCEG